jgi:hypothetical protein
MMEDELMDMLAQVYEHVSPEEVEAIVGKLIVGAAIKRKERNDPDDIHQFHDAKAALAAGDSTN